MVIRRTIRWRVHFVEDNGAEEVGERGGGRRWRGAGRGRLTKDDKTQQPRRFCYLNACPQRELSFIQRVARFEHGRAVSFNICRFPFESVAGDTILLSTETTGYLELIVYSYLYKLEQHGSWGSEGILVAVQIRGFN